MVVLLVALVIVAFLAQSALKRYGLLGAPTVAKPGAAGGIGPATLDPSVATPAPSSPIERARGVEQTLQQGAQDQSKRIDEQTK
jgi:cytochrome c-type biogenesis protein CcmH/NrfG